MRKGSRKTGELDPNTCIQHSTLGSSPFNALLI